MGLWSGDDWQAYCDELMIARHGADYQRIPDELGDYGAEGFTCDGTLIQAYAAEEVVDSKKLNKAQQDKVTRDLKTVIENRSKLHGMIGDKITRFILMVPEFRRKELVEHCGRKAGEVREQEWPEFAADFDIRVLTGDDFPEERRRLGEGGLDVKLTVDAIPEDFIETWVSSNSEFTASLKRKLDGAGLSETKRPGTGAALIRLHLRRQELLRQLRTQYPALWERLDAEARGREQTLAVENALNGASPEDRLQTLSSELEGRYAQAVPGVRANCYELGWGTVAEWLLRCPLELAQGAARA